MTPRVCLVIPPSSFLLDEKVFPSLGILKVAAALEQQQVPVHVVDLSGVSAERLDSVVRDHFWEGCEPTHVGVTATMPQMPFAASIAKTIRQVRPQATLILGGPHVTLMQASARKEGTFGRARQAMAELETIFDVCVAGDGERAIFAALEAAPVGH